MKNNPIACIIEVYKAPHHQYPLSFMWTKPIDFRPTNPESKFQTVAIFKVKLK